jgi:hypothetical protein
MIFFYWVFLLIEVWVGAECVDCTEGGTGCRVISKLLSSDFQACLSSGCSALPNPQQYL